MLIIQVNQILGLFLLVNLLDHVDPLSVSLSLHEKKNNNIRRFNVLTFLNPMRKQTNGKYFQPDTRSDHGPVLQCRNISTCVFSARDNWMGGYK